MAGAITHTYRYPFTSSIEREPQGAQARLATSGAVHDSPYFFQGSLRQPRITAQALRTLSNVVGARYYIPPAMLARILREADPVVTCGGGLLRFEAFSACASAYARVDLTPDAYRGVVVAQGTTNVDFNAAFRAALAQIRDTENVGFAIGTDEVTLLRGADQIVERKVDLPVRWLKGFVEVQAYQTRLEPRFEVGRVESMRFLRSVPRNPDSHHVSWVVAQGTGLRLSQQEAPDGVRITGLKRLRLLEDLAPLASTLRVYGSPDSQASEWQLDLGPLRFSLTLSAETWRGFSGEGQVLSALTHEKRQEALEWIRSSLSWQAELHAASLAAVSGLEPAALHGALAALGSRGLVGYDVARGAYFHRELPFAMDLVEGMHPRLVAARALLERNAVRIVSKGSASIEAEVKGSDVVHRVRLLAAGPRCTCVWYAKHQGERGPCKHVLALQMLLEPSSENP